MKNQIHVESVYYSEPFTSIGLASKEKLIPDTVGFGLVGQTHLSYFKLLFFSTLHLLCEWIVWDELSIIMVAFLSSIPQLVALNFELHRRERNWKCELSRILLEVNEDTSKHVASSFGKKGSMFWKEFCWKDHGEKIPSMVPRNSIKGSETYQQKHIIQHF